MSSIYCSNGGCQRVSHGARGEGGRPLCDKCARGTAWGVDPRTLPRTITLTLHLTRAASLERAAAIAESAACHLMETFNDDGSLKTITYEVTKGIPS